MAAIAAVNIPNMMDQDPVSVTAVLPFFARKDEAVWEQATLPEIGRAKMTYQRRPPAKGIEMVRHTFRVTWPTLKSVVTDPAGPFVPAPVLDYNNVAELSVWVHPRATLAERDRIVAAFTQAPFAGTLVPMLTDVVINGNALY